MKSEKKEPKVIPPSPDTTQPTKMRVKLYEAGNLISDRLVEQFTEFTLGPKAVHLGPMSLELNLTCREEVEAAIVYLQKLKGDLPLVANVKKSSTKKIDEMLSEKEPLLDLLKTLKGKAVSQEKLIAMLREYKFRFLTSQAIVDSQQGLESPMIKLRDRDLDYQFMSRLIKEARDPSNDKYDYRLTIGIKIVGEKVSKVRIYLWGEYSETIELPWEKEKTVNFKKVEKLYSFPEWMDYADRKRWRLENRKWEIATENGKNEVPFEFSKAYMKAKPYVKVH